MKQYCFKVPDNYCITNGSFRERKDYVNALIRFMNLTNTISLLQLSCIKENANVILNVDKMSRLFIVREESIHSIHFPFFVTEVEGDLRFYFENHIIDSKSLSIVEAIETLGDRTKMPFEIFFDEFLSVMNDFDVENSLMIDWYWRLIYFMSQVESGYLRYDYDTKIPETDIHPKSHVDFFYEGNNSFKIGLHKRIGLGEILQIVDIQEHCWMMER